MPPRLPRRPPPVLPPGAPPADPFAGVDEQHAYRLAYAEPGLKLRELFDVLVRGRWIILGALLAVAVPITLRTLAKPDLYSAYSLLLIQEEDEGLSDVLPSGPNPLAWQAERDLGNELLILRQSLPLARRAAERLLNYRAVPETGQPLTVLAGDPTPTPEVVAARLQNHYLSVAAEGRELDAIRITAVSTVPGEAALLANVYAEAYLERTQESSRASVTASRAFLEEQIGAQADSLRAIEAQIRAFMTQEGAVALDEESSFLVSQAARLEAERDEATVEVQMRGATADALGQELAALEPRLAARVASDVDRELTTTQTRLATVEARLEEIYAARPALRTAAEVPPDIAQLRQQQADLQGRLRTLRQRYLDESLAAGGLDLTQQGAGLERVAELRRQIVDEQIALGAARAKRDVLAQRLRANEGSLSAIPRQAIELAQLQRRRQSTERLYLALEEKLQEARVAEQSELGYAELIRPATTPGIPYAPNRPRGIFLGVLLGLGLGIVLAFVRVRLDHRLHRPDDLRERGYPVLGTIPDLDPLVKEEFQGAETVEADGRRLDSRLVALLSPLSGASEAYRALRTSLQFSRPDTVVQTVLVTSASPGEGKSLTALNLAVTLAQAGRKTLLIDADLRRPSVHKRLALPRTPGLVDLLFSGGDSATTLPESGVDDLTVLAAGTHAPNPSELLGSRALRDLVEAARQAYDVIIFDAPPVLAATDAVLLSTQCDATFLVARAGQTRDYALEQAQEALEGVGAHVIGVVLNGFQANQAYGYKYRYSYRSEGLYGYGAENAAKRTTAA
ncbi:MAG TPA: polysaccharide biosynthesis tyrosine autokinase [Rubricoccaceae bacterium]|nr:polysaccharide biosynthesis tyrosine autokinase [Rubricoccaceae bacterium]